MRKEKKKRGRKWKEKGLGRRHHVTERMNNLIFHLQIKNLFLNWKSFEASHWCEHQVLLSKGRFGLRLLSIWFLTGNIQFPLKTKGCSCINSNGNLDKALEQTRNKQLFWQSWEIGGNYFKKPHTHKKKKTTTKKPRLLLFPCPALCSPAEKMPSRTKFSFVLLVLPKDSLTPNPGQKGFITKKENPIESCMALRTIKLHG